MRLDMFRRVRMRSDAFGCIGMRSENFGNFGPKNAKIRILEGMASASAIGRFLEATSMGAVLVYPGGIRIILNGKE